MELSDQPLLRIVVSTYLQFAMPKVPGIFAVPDQVSLPCLVYEHHNFLVFRTASHRMQVAILPLVTNPLLNGFEQFVLANLQLQNMFDFDRWHFQARAYGFCYKYG